MTELALFASAFATVFLLVFQQQNVIHRNHGMGTATSLLIGLSQLTLWRYVPEASIAQLAAALAGGPIGFNAALWVHPMIIKRMAA